MAAIKRAQTFTPNTIRPVIYSDFLSSFEPHPNIKDLPRVANEDSVKQSIRNIILTKRGERPFSPELGSDVTAILFENMTAQTQSILRSYIETCIANYEPRARIIDIIITPLFEINAYAATIVFSVINKSEPVTLELLLERVR